MILFRFVQNPLDLIFSNLELALDVACNKHRQLICFFLAELVSLRKTKNPKFSNNKRFFLQETREGQKLFLIIFYPLSHFAIQVNSTSS